MDHTYIVRSFMEEIDVMLKRLKVLEGFSQLDTENDLHLPLTAAQSENFLDAIRSLELVLNPV